MRRFWRKRIGNPFRIAFSVPATWTAEGKTQGSDFLRLTRQLVFVLPFLCVAGAVGQVSDLGEPYICVNFFFWESHHRFFIFNCGLVQLRITAVTIHGGTPIGDFTQSLMEDSSGVVWAGPWNNPPEDWYSQFFFSSESLTFGFIMPVWVRCKWLSGGLEHTAGLFILFLFWKATTPTSRFFLPFLNMRPCLCASDMYPRGHSGEFQHASPRRSLTSFSGFSSVPRNWVDEWRDSDSKERDRFRTLAGEFCLRNLFC